ncbi:MAG: HEPN domain-containing protein [Ruminococcus sp.]|nr:HEPN domain-containing protein [Ruminococcus sp.]
MGLTEEERDALVTYRVQKSKEVFKEATDVANLGHWNLAVNRLYYAVFHICSAVLLSKGFTARTHSGVIQIMMKEYVKTTILSKEEGVLISTLFNMRHSGDYDDMFDWDEFQVSPLIEPVNKLLSKIEQLIL